jgi:hypothetical protein
VIFQENIDIAEEGLDYDAFKFNELGEGRVCQLTY